MTVRALVTPSETMPARRCAFPLRCGEKEGEEEPPPPTKTPEAEEQQLGRSVNTQRAGIHFTATSAGVFFSLICQIIEGSAGESGRRGMFSRCVCWCWQSALVCWEKGRRNNGFGKVPCRVKIT